MIWLFADSSTVGGVERHIQILAEGLMARGLKTQVIALQDHGNNPWFDQLKQAGVPFRCLDGSPLTLARELRKHRPGVLHTHGYKANILGRFAAKLTGTPVVATFHSGDRLPLPTGFWQRLDEATSILGSRISVSENVARAIPYKSEQIANFLLAPPPPGERALPREVGFLGRLSHEKAPDLFCQIADALADEDIAFHVWGDGAMRADLEAQFGGRVTFHGIATDVAPVFARIGLLLMPSRVEGLPMALLEAFAAGIPVAASRVGAVPTVIEHETTGWLFEPEDNQAAIEAVRKWSRLSPAEGITMRQRCWQTLRDRFSDVTQVPLILKMYARAGWKAAPSASSDPGEGKAA